MSQLGRLSLFLSALALIAGAVISLILQTTSVVVLVPFSLFILFLVIAVIKDFRFFKDFFSMRTTKHGMNLGTLIILALLLLVTLNFIAYNNNKKWDVTQEKINSVSEQTTSVLKSLDSELKIYGFYTEQGPEDLKDRERFNSLAQMYKYENSKVHVELVNPNKRPDLKKQYNVELSGTVVLDYKGKQKTVTDLTEQNVTNAILSLSRGKSKVAYFIQGHGELDPDDTEKPNGVGFFKTTLQDATLEVKKLNLITTPKIPEDAAVVAILGPYQPLLENEVSEIMNFVKRGGGLLVAADPGRKHNIAQLTKRLGVEFLNTYIVDPLGIQLRQGPTFVLGITFSRTSEITKLFKEGTVAGFPTASPIQKAPDAPASLKFETLVQTSPTTWTSSEPPRSASHSDKDKTAAQTVAMAVSGKLENDGKDFNAVVFGDSDFLTNVGLSFQLNRDLAANTASFLARDPDLITIRPKELAKSQLLITPVQGIIFALVVYTVPLLFFALGLGVWYRRRNA